jgi:nitrate/nitrite transporter NarK
MQGLRVSIATDDAPLSSEGPVIGTRWRRGFWSLIATQFQGAFSDNALKNLTVFLIIGMGLTVGRRDFLISSIEAIFSIPFILFSMYGGFLADRFSKRSVMLGVKFLEVAIMIFATAGLMLQSVPLLLSS